jgi:hypothetical protein
MFGVSTPLLRRGAGVRSKGIAAGTRRIRKAQKKFVQFVQFVDKKVE